MSADDSPLLIAVYRVLLRLLAPRHPPRALKILFSGLLCCQSLRRVHFPAQLTLSIRLIDPVHPSVAAVTTALDKDYHLR